MQSIIDSVNFVAQLIQSLFTCNFCGDPAFACYTGQGHYQLCEYHFESDVMEGWDYDTKEEHMVNGQDDMDWEPANDGLPFEDENEYITAEQIARIDAQYEAQQADRAWFLADQNAAIKWMVENRDTDKYPNDHMIGHPFGYLTDLINYGARTWTPEQWLQDLTYNLPCHHEGECGDFCPLPFD